MSDLNVKLLVQFGLNVHLLHCHNMGKVYQNPFCLKNYLISQPVLIPECLRQITGEVYSCR